jgi:hypothetical protein
MPAQNRVGRDEARHRARRARPSRCPNTASRRRWASVKRRGRWPICARSARFSFDQLGDGVGFALVEPRGHGEEQETHCRQVNHAGSIAQNT